MKIEIEIDIEAIVREEVRNYIRENIVIKNVVAKEVTTNEVVAHKEPEVIHKEPATVSEEPQEAFEPEFAKVPGKRRSKAEIHMYDEEMRLGRNLTPQEKGTIKAKFEIDDKEEQEAEEMAKSKAKAEALAAKIEAETKAELEQEQEIPKTDELKSVSSLFG